LIGSTGTVFSRATQNATAATTIATPTHKTLFFDNAIPFFFGKDEERGNYI
jgi:hypothetical protein